jgi:hypothetical protein
MLFVQLFLQLGPPPVGNAEFLYVIWNTTLAYILAPNVRFHLPIILNSIKETKLIIL